MQMSVTFCKFLSTSMLQSNITVAGESYALRILGSLVTELFVPAKEDVNICMHK